MSRWGTHHEQEQEQDQQSKSIPPNVQVGAQSSTMNVLNKRGGHISRTSNHQVHQKNLNHPNHYRGIGGTNESVGYNNGLGTMAS